MQIGEKLVRPERIELPTSWFVAKHSIQLSYGRIVAELRVLNYNGTKSFRPTPIAGYGQRKNPAVIDYPSGPRPFLYAVENSGLGRVPAANLMM